MASFIARAIVVTVLAGLVQARAQAQPPSEPAAAGVKAEKDKVPAAMLAKVQVPAWDKGSLLLYSPREGKSPRHKQPAAYGLFVPAGKCVTALPGLGQYAVLKVEPQQDCNGLTGACSPVTAAAGETLDLASPPKPTLSDSCANAPVTGGSTGAEYLVVRVMNRPLIQKGSRPITMLNADQATDAEIAAPRGMKRYIVAKGTLVARGDGKGNPEPMPTPPPPPPPGPIVPDDFHVKTDVRTLNLGGGAPAAFRAPTR